MVRTELTSGRYLLQHQAHSELKTSVSLVSSSPLKSRPDARIHSRYTWRGRLGGRTAICLRFVACCSSVFSRERHGVCCGKKTTVNTIRLRRTTLRYYAPVARGTESLLLVPCGKNRRKVVRSLPTRVDRNEVAP
jgi:hypothetical protein